jgi:hypothetical protein
MDSGVTENPGAETGQRVNALVAGLRKELREVRDQANRYVVEAATLRLKLREAEALATAGVTLARYCETIGWNTGDARAPPGPVRPCDPRAIRRGDRLVVFDGSAVSAVIHLVGPLEDWGDGPGGEP